MAVRTPVPELKTQINFIAVPVPLPQRKSGLLRVLAIVRDCRPGVVLTTRRSSAPWRTFRSLAVAFPWPLSGVFM